VHDTIAAIATAPGGAARGMVRVSGPATLELVSRCFRSDSPDGIPGTAKSASIHAGNLSLQLAGESRALPCDLYLWPHDRSYTRQPVAELHTLGSPPLMRAALNTICQVGARLAEPGEFTLRAFLAGRLDLTQAEAVLGVIDARQADQLATALHQLAGGLAGPLHHLRDELVGILAELEAGLDFVEEDIQFISADELVTRLQTIATEICAVADQMSSRFGGETNCQVVLIGPPNSGKSSLFNALVERYGTSEHRTAAIVSKHSGTTRDYLVAEINLGGICCQLVDTAGVEQNPLGEIAAAAQRLGEDRRRQAVVRAYCVDTTGSADSAVPPAELLIVTKADLAPNAVERIAADHTGQPIVVTSSVTGEGLDTLRQSLTQLLSNDASTTTTNCIAATADRCRDSLRLAADAVARAIEVAQARGGDELVAVELRDCLDQLGKVVGTVYTDDLLDRIFKTFCIGK
jgi:tRNA modification GTPase